MAMSLKGLDLKTSVSSMVTGYTFQSGEPLVDTLLTRGGMVDMMHVTLIAFCAETHVTDR